MKNQNELFNAEGFPILGWCVHYAAKNFSIPFVAFQSILEKAGIDKRFAKETMDRNALIRAVKSVTKGNSEFHRNIAEREDIMALAIVSEEKGQVDISVDYDVESKIVFDKASKEIVITGKYSNEIKGKKDEFKEMYTADQFRSLVKRFLKTNCSAITVREGGGLYFIPKSDQRNLEKLVALFEELGLSVDITLIPIIDTKTSRSSMWKSTTKEIEEDVKELTKDFEEMSDSVTEKMIEARINKYNGLKNKIEMFETLLQGTAESMKTKLDELTETIQKKLC